MSEYHAPIDDMQFVLHHVAGLDEILELDEFQGMDKELITAILDESARFTTNVLDPLNTVGDQQGSTCENGEVTTPPGWKAAYQQFIDGGWNGLSFDVERGGQGLPWLVATAVQEMWHSANMSFGLCPLLTQGAIRALESHGSKVQQDTYMERLISGEWAGTMNLTEAQAGSDLAAIRTRAVAQNGHYRITGQKIFITYGEHDLTENIVHFVLARCTDSPDGVKGISLFIVPKFLVNEDGTVGERNDLRCVSLEHKLGIHASPTAVMSYGDNGGAIGYLVGEKNRGLEYMFTMMNLARHAVGVEGLAVSERAYQHALEYARQRVQGTVAGSRQRVAIIQHPDVKRMLMTMKALIDAMRCLAYYTAGVFDLSIKHPDEVARQNNADLLSLLIPLVKGWCGETGNEVAYLGVQIHGGMGFIEETGAAQYCRDVRITPIYEGTTGIQANDLIGRKVLHGNREVLERLTAKISSAIESSDQDDKSIVIIAQAVRTALEHFDRVTEWVYQTGGTRPQETAAASVGYMHAFSLTVAGWLMLDSASVAAAGLRTGTGNAAHLKDKLMAAKFFATHVLPRTQAHADAAINSSAVALELEEV